MIVPTFQDNTHQPGYTANDYQFSGLTSENYPTYPTLSTGGSGAWPTPIKANGGTLAQNFNRPNSTQTTDFLSGPAFGGGIYTFFSETTFSINQTAPLSNMSSLTFQLFQAAGVDASATNNLYVGLPTLTLNLANSTQAILTASAATILSSNAAVIFGQSTALDDVGFTFNVSGLTAPVTSYTLNWTEAQHSIVYGTDITEFSPQAVPEPSTWAMLMLAVIFFVIYRGRMRHGQIR